jgi:hypothetical protein
MNTSFAEQVQQKMKALQQFDSDHLFTTAELEQLSVTFVEEDQALSSLDYQSQIDVHIAVFHLKAGIERKPGTLLALGAWFTQLTSIQRAQVIRFLVAKRFGRNGSIILHWYPNKQQFRIERDPHPR